MLKVIPDLPAGVVGVEADGKVTADDYEQVLVPAFQAARAASGDGKVRLMYVLSEHGLDYTAGAMWEDTKLGLGHLRAWERVAVVSDADWLHKAMHAFGWIMPGEVRAFGLSELDDARKWVIAG
jgi:hypothetical protein